MDSPNSKDLKEEDRPKRARKTKRIVEQVELSKDLKSCQRVLVSLLSHRFASPFSAPVDPVRLGIPDYLTIVKNPMDLGTVKEKINAGEYDTVDQFKQDVELVFANCELYNPPGSDIVTMCSTLREYYNSQMAPILASMKAEAAQASATANSTSSSTTTNNSDDLDEMERKRVKKRKTDNKQSTSTPPPTTGTVPYNEKVRLARAVAGLKETNLGPVIDILMKYREIDPETSVVKDEVVVDLDSVCNEALRELSTYVYSIVPRPEI